MNFDDAAIHDEALEQRISFDTPELDDDDDDEDKHVPSPLYMCSCKKDPNCNSKHPHPADPIVYSHVTRDTPCRFCGHTGTLYKVN